MTVFRGIVTLIALHSCTLGTLMLFFPGWMIQVFGFPATSEFFFPSQSGIFLLILGLCYGLALARPQLILVIVISKALAVVFLLVHAAFLAAPTSIWLAGAGDAVMLLVVLAGLHRLGWRQVLQGSPDRGE